MELSAIGNWVFTSCNGFPSAGCQNHASIVLFLGLTLFSTSSDFLSKPLIPMLYFIWPSWMSCVIFQFNLCVLSTILPWPS
jgi:hypothetical protein